MQSPQKEVQKEYFLIIIFIKTTLKGTFRVIVKATEPSYNTNEVEIEIIIITLTHNFLFSTKATKCHDENRGTLVFDIAVDVIILNISACSYRCLAIYCSNY